MFPIQELILLGFASATVLWCYHRFRQLPNRSPEESQHSIPAPPVKSSLKSLSRLHTTNKSSAPPPNTFIVREHHQGESTRIDVEEETSTSGTSSFYFHVRLPLENAQNFRHIPALHSRSPTSTFRIFRHRDHPNQMDSYRLLISRSFVQGTVRHGYEFEEDKMTAFNIQPSQFGRTRIHFPNVLQVLKDVIAPIFGDQQHVQRSHGPVGSLSEFVLGCESLDDWTHSNSFRENSEAFSAWELSERVGVECVESLCPPDGWQATLASKQISYPVLRHFWFEGIPHNLQLDPVMINDLPFAQLTHITLQNVTLSFDDCLELISTCTSLHTLCLCGNIGDGESVSGLFSHGHCVPLFERLGTRMKRLEIHSSSAADVSLFVTKLQFQGRRNILALDFSTEGIGTLNVPALLSWIPAQGFAEIWLPLAIQGHPKVVFLSQAVAQQSSTYVNWVS